MLAELTRRKIELESLRDQWHATYVLLKKKKELATARENAAHHVFSALDNMLEAMERANASIGELVAGPPETSLAEVDSEGVPL